ncbi:MAG: hypothetical protein JWQ69_5503, partial [Pseudomonas sp.]|nr:hypothetical protein [Pseudomonas sp.]
MAYQFSKSIESVAIAFDCPLIPPTSSHGRIRNCRDFLRLFQRSISPEVQYDASFFGKGVCHALGVSLDLEITHNLPLAYRKRIRTAAGGVQSPPLSSWLASGKPLLVKVPGKSRSTWEENFITHGYRNMAIHGFTDEETGRISIFGFYNYQSVNDERMVNTLNDIAAVTHNALHEIPKTIERE